MPIIQKIKMEDRQRLEDHCTQMALVVDTMKEKFTAEERRQIKQESKKGLQMAKKMQDSQEINAFYKKLSEINEIYEPIVTRVKELDKQRLEEYCAQMKQTLED